MDSRLTKAPLPNIDTLAGRLKEDPDYTPWYVEQDRRIARNPFNMLWRNFGRVPFAHSEVRPCSASKGIEQASSSSVEGFMKQSDKKPAPSVGLSLQHDGLHPGERNHQQHPQEQQQEQQQQQCLKPSSPHQRPSSQMSTSSRSRFGDRLIASWSGPHSQVGAPSAMSALSQPSTPAASRKRLFLQAAGGAPRKLNFAAPDIANPELFNGRKGVSAQSPRPKAEQASPFHAPTAPAEYRREFVHPNPSASARPVSTLSQASSLPCASPRSLQASLGAGSPALASYPTTPRANLTTVAGALRSPPSPPVMPSGPPSLTLPTGLDTGASAHGKEHSSVVKSGGNPSARHGPPQAASSEAVGQHAVVNSEVQHTCGKTPRADPPTSEAAAADSHAAASSPPRAPKMSAPAFISMLAPCTSSVSSPAGSKEWSSISTKTMSMRRAADQTMSSGGSAADGGTVTRGQVYAVFSCLDEQGTNKLTYSMIESAAVDIGMKPDQVKNFFAMLDPNRRGYCTIEDWGSSRAQHLVKSFVRLYLVRASELQRSGVNPAGFVLKATSLRSAIQLVTLKMKMKNRGRLASIEKYRDAFKFIDENGNGVLDTEELADAFSGLGISVSAEVIDESMAYFDKDNSKELDYMEFMQALYPLIAGSSNEARGKCSGGGRSPAHLKLNA